MLWTAVGLSISAHQFAEPLQRALRCARGTVVSSTNTGPALRERMEH